MDDIDTRILTVFQKVAFLIESQWEDLEGDDLEPEDDRFYDLDEKDLLENGANVYGNDGDPYVEDEFGAHRDIHPDLTLNELDDFEDGEDDGLSLARELIEDFDKDSIDRHDDEDEDLKSLMKENEDNAKTPQRDVEQVGYCTQCGDMIAADQEFCNYCDSEYDDDDFDA
jgi:hypothetical protein